VIEGMDVVDRIGKVRTDSNGRPFENITILRITILE
jgi:cyclophilin family peptidyl-prolyl cis-trans isomerase